MQEEVYKQFFEQYIIRFFNETSLIPSFLHIPKALYLFAYTDYFGKIAYVADTANTSKIGHSKNNFVYLIENYFPIEFRGLGVKIYDLYRCGIMHSVYPKNCGLDYLIENNYVLLETKVGIPSQRYKIEVLNLWKYEVELNQVIINFSKAVISGNADVKVSNIHKLLTDDIFGDKTASEIYG